MYWKKILETARDLRQELKQKADNCDKKAKKETRRGDIYLAYYYIGRTDGYKDATGRLNDLITSYRVK